jgi:hypothetical protein
MEFRREIRESEPYDVVVCGGGPSGCAAALSARREGLKILLIECMGQLGGMAVTGMVSHWLGGRTQEGEWVVGGIFRSLSEEAAGKGYALIPSLNPGEKYQPFGWYNWFIHGIPLDPFSIDFFLDGKMEQAGVNVLLNTHFVDTAVCENKVSHVIIYNRSGLMAVPTKAVIDACGNADVAFKSGCHTLKGREENGLMTPASLIFHIYNINEEKLTKFIEQEKDPKLRNLIRSLKESGEWPFAYNLFISTRLIEKGEFLINTVRLIGVDGTDGESISHGMVKGREEIHQLMQIFRKHFPGFERAKIKTVAPQLGIRETRRIIGDYILTVDDLSNERVFDDTIGFSMYGWDLPDPKKPSEQPFAYDETGGYRYKVKKGLYTPLPYRIMVPKPITNIICPGRAVSVERQVLGPVRVMAPCMAMGEAAGIAAAEVVRTKGPFSEVNVLKLRENLRLAGAIVDVHSLPPIYPRVDQI